MNNQKGFTLIELIVVIVILGILSAVAVPKFVDMQDDARKGVLNGIRGSFKSSISMIHAKSLIAASGDTAVVTEGGSVTLINAYPQADEANLPKMVDLDTLLLSDDPDTDGFTATEGGVAGDGNGTATLKVVYGGYEFTYTETDSSSTPPVLTAVTKTP